MREIARLVAAAAAAALLTRSVVVGGADRRMGAIAVVVVVSVLSALALWGEGAITFAAAALAAAYVMSLYIGRVPADPDVAVVAMLLVVFVTAADLGMSVPPDTPLDGAFVRRRLSSLAGALVLTALVATGAVLVAALPAGTSTVARAVGMAGAVAAVAAAVRLAR